MRRRFFIFHPWGASESYGETAAEAERAASEPGGFKHVLAVIDARVVATPRDPYTKTFEGLHARPVNPAMPFVAMVEATAGAFQAPCRPSSQAVKRPCRAPKSGLPAATASPHIL